jgi:XTP/dITP diphosphohydrolase
MAPLYFVSTNHNKYLEIESILQKYHISVVFSKLVLTEIQSDSIEEIAIEKSKYAFAEISRPVIVEDDGLFICQLNGFPGQYSSYVYKTIGNDGILKLMNNSKQRFAIFKSSLAFSDDMNHYGFTGEAEGRIAFGITEGGWGYDPIFIPNGSDLTFGQLQVLNRKTEFSHRAKALNRFAQWYNQNYKGMSTCEYKRNS